MTTHMKNNIKYPLLAISDNSYYEDEIGEARNVIRQTLLNNPDKRAGVSFSCGKDSLLLALLCVEVSKEIGRERPILMSSFVPYEVDREKEWNQYLIDNIRGVDWVGARPGNFYRFGIWMLGIGTIPPAPTVKECNKLLKVQPFDLLKKQYQNDVIIYAGTRNEESVRRRKRFVKYGFIQPRYVAPISKISGATLWNYLEKNLYKINIDIDLLKLNYANKSRGGCWFCSNQHKDDLPDGLEKAIHERFTSIISIKHKNYYELLVKYGDLTPTQAYRTKLVHCKQWYNELLELQKQYGRELLTELDKKFIFEIWNYREKRHERIYQKDFLEDVKTGAYTMLYPELFDIAFVFKRGRYVYRHGETFIVRNESGLLND